MPDRIRIFPFEYAEIIIIMFICEEGETQRERTRTQYYIQNSKIFWVKQIEQWWHAHCA